MLLAPLRAAVDLDFARRAARRSGRWAAGYLAYLGLLFAVAAALALRASFGPRWHEAIRWAQAAMPRVVLDHGQARSDAKGPLRLAHPGPPAWTIVVDTDRRAPVTLEEMRRDDVSAYLARETLYLRPIPERMDAYPVSRLSGGSRLVLDAGFYRDLGAAIPRVVYPAAFVGAWMLFVAWKLAATVVYAALAALFAAGTPEPPDRPTRWKLALLAQTPAILLQIALLSAPERLPFSSLALVGLTCVYLWRLTRPEAADVTPP